MTFSRALRCSKSWIFWKVRPMPARAMRCGGQPVTSTPLNMIMPAVGRNRPETIDIIGDSVYWLYANLFDLTRQTARDPGCDRTDARRVCACAAGLCCGLCRTLSARQDLGRQGAPTPGRWRRQSRLVAAGRQGALYSGLSADESAANDARIAIRAEPTPDPLLDSSPAPSLAARLSRARHGPRTRCEPGRYQPPHPRGRPPYGH